MTSPLRSLGPQPAPISPRSSSPHVPHTFSAVWTSTARFSSSMGLLHLSHPSEGSVSSIFSGVPSVPTLPSLIVTFIASSQGLLLIQGSSPRSASFCTRRVKGVRKVHKSLLHAFCTFRTFFIWHIQ